MGFVDLTRALVSAKWPGSMVELEADHSVRSRTVDGEQTFESLWLTAGWKMEQIVLRASLMTHTDCDSLVPGSQPCREN